MRLDLYETISLDWREPATCEQRQELRQKGLFGNQDRARPFLKFVA